MGGALRDSPRSSIFTSGRRVNCGRVGASFSPECDAARGREGTGWGEIRLRGHLTLQPPREGWGTRRPRGGHGGHLLEAQHTNTFIFRQARRWLCVGVAARKERAGGLRSG